jgi:hypothetical protein
VLIEAGEADGVEQIAESGAAGLLRWLHDGRDGPGSVGPSMPPPHRAVIVL